MTPLIPILVAAGAAAYFLAKKTPGGISADAKKQLVPVMLGDGRTVSPTAHAEWHATNDQNKLFGPRRPNYWNLNGYFMFASASKPGTYDFYKPDWQVPVTTSASAASGAGYLL